MLNAEMHNIIAVVGAAPSIARGEEEEAGGVVMLFQTTQHTTLYFCTTLRHRADCQAARGSVTPSLLSGVRRVVVVRA